ncbi:monocarboxylate transporter 9-like [Tubulanus polymorphus]|uniref:monocarboxylate transporter 9-like n=1 Tax=Tubulanus polymorphus TaxID=672921 RepID=UPI003DA27D63
MPKSGRNSRHASKSSSSSSSSDSDSDSSDSSTSTLPMPTPPDGGYGWIVVLAAFIANLLADGVAFSFGVLLDEFLDYFNESKSKTAWIGSLFHGIPLICGPISCAFINKFGCRKVCIAGGFVSSIGFILSFFSPNIDFLCFSFGILAGFGLSMVYTPAVVIVAFYFEKRRAFASGLSVSGSGIGAVIFAPLCEKLIEWYGWRGTLWIIGGLMLHFIICGALYRPLETKRERKRRKLMRSLDRLSRLRNESSNKSESSSESLNDGSYHKKNHRRRLLRQFSEPLHHSLITFPTFMKASAQNHPKQSKSDNVIDDMTSNSKIPDGEDSQKFSVKANSVSCIDNPETTDTPESTLSDPVVILINGARKPEDQALPDNDLMINFANSNSDTAGQTVDAPAIDEINTLNDATTLHNNKSNGHHHHRKTSATKRDESQFLPLYRRDIFYRGSLLRLSSIRDQVTSHSCPNVYQMHDDDSSSSDDSSDGKPCRCHGRKHIRNVIREMLDITILKNPLYLLLFISNFILYMWFDIAYFFLPNYATELGVSDQRAAMAISITGIANMLGQIFFGVIGDRPELNTAYVYGAATAVCGVASLFVPFCREFISIWVYSAVFGFFIGANYSLVSVIIVKALLSLEKLTNAYGIIMCGQGVANLIGPPLAGYLYDITGNYTATFVCGGVWIFISGVMLFLVKPIKMCQKCCAKYRSKESSSTMSGSSSRETNLQTTCDIELKSASRGVAL